MMNQMKKYYKTPTKLQFIVTLSVSMFFFIPYALFLIDYAGLGGSNFFLMLIPELLIIFNYLLWKNYIYNDLPKVEPISIKKN